MDKNYPHNALKSLPPKADLESKAILKKAIMAHRELAELKGSSTYEPISLKFLDPSSRRSSIFSAHSLINIKNIECMHDQKI
jgi:hypothetical protein